MLHHITVLVNDCHRDEVVVLVDLVHKSTHHVQSVSVLDHITVVLSGGFTCAWFLVSVLITHVRVCSRERSSVA